MPRRHGGLVVDAQHASARRCVRPMAPRSGRRLASGPRLGLRQLDREHRAAARHRLQVDLAWPSTLPMRSTIDRPEAEAPHRARRLLQPLELLEDERALGFGDAGAGVADQHRQPVAAPAHAQQHLARRGVLDGIGQRGSAARGAAAAGPSAPTRASAPCAARAPSRAPAARTPPSAARTPRCRGKTVMSGSSLPVSRREISIRTPRISSTASSEASMLRASVASWPPSARSTRLVA